MKWPFFVLLLANIVFAMYLLLQTEPDRREQGRVEQQLHPEKIRLLP